MYIFITRLIGILVWFRSFVDIKGDKFQLTKITKEGERTIIWGEKFIFDDMRDILDDIKIDEMMVNCIFLTFEMINNNDKICLKNFMGTYKDLEGKYYHTLRNICEFNNIECNDDATINVKLIRDKKIVSYNMLFNDVGDRHINYFINLGRAE